MWRHLVEGRSNFFLYAVMPTLVVTAAYASGSVLCWILDALPSLRKYKIQPKVHPPAEWWHCIRHILFHKLTSEIPLTFASYPLFVWLGVSKDLPLPGAWTVVGTLAASFVIEDAWHYFAHRTLHIRWLYKHVHGIHHRYTTPFGVAANYAHPVETIFTGFGTVLPMLLFRPHLFTLLVWVVVRQWQAISVHVGYEFPWRPSRYLPILGGARFHDHHHRRPKCNYAPTFIWLDYLLGTAEKPR
jgi:4-alpha-methyl-delta7-sterol-4alpha-methyl oxidase